ncbi:FliH/SctL family protein [uncultured Roseovarius sp.]|uniref:FliH/SctL family protein n=1 Tax=uncultured Roseovarius sp. TaxID=293344 RepID=UPI002632C4E9|nr:FliH/SctL family protein [uncultured Roseovarius sp.]
MSISHLLDDFGPIAQGTPLAMTDISLEEERLEAFEKGYQAGWDDSVKSQIEDGRRITADLSQNLQDLSFTYEEVHTSVMDMMHPLLQQIIATVLPAVCHATLSSRITEILHDLIDQQDRQPVEVSVGPDDKPILDQLAADLTDVEFEIVEDTALTSGQIFLRIGQNERSVDLQDVLKRIEQAVSGFFLENRKAVA